MNRSRIEHLEQLSKDLLYGEVSPLEVASLNVFDRISVLGGWFLCSLTRLGVLAVHYGKIAHLKMLHEVDEIIRKTEIFAQSHLRWLKSIKETSCLRTEIVKEIKQGDGSRLLKLVCQLLDEMTGENIYLKMAEQNATDDEFKANIMQCAKENIDELQEKFGLDVPYLRLLESFFACCDEDGISALYKRLEPEELLQAAQVPPKAEPEFYNESVKVIKDNAKRMYPER